MNEQADSLSALVEMYSNLNLPSTSYRLTISFFGDCSTILKQNARVSEIISTRVFALRPKRQSQMF